MKPIVGEWEKQPNVGAIVGLPGSAAHLPGFRKRRLDWYAAA